MTDRGTWGNNGEGKEDAGEIEDGKINGVRICEVDSFHGAQRSGVE